MTIKKTLKRDGMAEYYFYRLNGYSLICVEFVDFLGIGRPKKITVYASNARIHRKGCHKIDMVKGDDYVYLNGKITNVYWHSALLNAITEHGLKNPFYIRVVKGEEA